MTSLWRLHIRPKGGLADPRISIDFCLRQGVVGMGWGMLAFTEKLAGKPADETATGELFDYLTDEDAENLVFVYLQTLGWFIYPATRRRDTPFYEYVLVHRDTGERGIVQVKTGYTRIDASAYEASEKAFLFAACGRYGDRIPPNVTIIERARLCAFMRDTPHLVPASVKGWTDLLGLPC